MPNTTPRTDTTAYNRFLLLVAGLGGLLYGVDVGIIGSALPYLAATFGLESGHALTAGEQSLIVAAVLLGSAVSTLVAGLLADWMGRRRLMVLGGVLFVLSIPAIALSHHYASLVTGRLLQGMSAGLIGVVVPLYLAECLGARNRGKGTGIFQWLLTAGIVTAAAIGMYFSIRVAEVARQDPARLLAFKDTAWRGIFWVSLPPGILFVIGSLMVSESPRWLFRKGRADLALRALLRSRSQEEADVEMEEMATVARAVQAKAAASGGSREPLLRRKYLIPFALACVILACNQATGVNSVIGYNTNILLQAGLTDLQAHWGYVLLTLVNFVLTIVGVLLVDRSGRKLLLSVGSAGIIASLVAVGLMFRSTERQRVDCRSAVQALVRSDQGVTLTFDAATASRLLGTAGGPGRAVAGRPLTLTVIYSYGDFRAATSVVRSDDPAPAPVSIAREDCVPANRVIALFTNPFGDLGRARNAPLSIDNAILTPVPSERNGWLTAVFTFSFMAFFAAGPGVCVWLALSELMPTRIRSNGMSIALLVNQGVSTVIALAFLPTVGKYGYSAMFFGFAACTVVYFVTAAFLLPETKGKTLEEIERHFEGA